MPRFVYAPGVASGVLPIMAGGTSARDADGASITLGFIRRNELNQPLGIATLDENGTVRSPIRYASIVNIPDNFGLQVGGPEGLASYGPDALIRVVDIPTGPNGILLHENGVIDQNLINGANIGVSYPTISGPSSLAAGQAGTYTITNYDVFGTYNLTAINGTVSRNADTITYTAPGVEGAGGFVINNRTIHVAITASGLNTPSITSPANNTLGYPQVPSFTSSPFSFYGTAQTHTNTRWEIASDALFSTVVSSYEGTSNLTSWTSSISLAADTQFYVRVRYRGSGGQWSNWSSAIAFKTGAVTDWVAAVGGGGNDLLADVVRDSSGNMYAVGYETSSTGSTNFPFIVKFTNSGTIVWQRKLTVSGAFYSIAIDGSGNVYALGSTPTENNMMIVAKFNSGGTLLSKVYVKSTDAIPFTHNNLPHWGGGSFNHSARGKIQLHSSGDLWIAYRGVLFKLDNNLSLQLAIQPQMTSSSYLAGYTSLTATSRLLPYDLVIDNAGNILTICGSYDRQVGIPANTAQPIDTIYYYSICRVCKFDTDGNLIWAAADSFNNVIGGGITVNTNNEIYICGAQAPYNYGVDGNGNNAQHCLIKLSSAGNLIWMRYLDKGTIQVTADKFNDSIVSYCNHYWNAVCFHNGFIYVTGNYNISSNETASHVAKIKDSDASVVWIKSLNTTGFDRFTSIKVYDETTLMLTGISNNQAHISLGTASDGIILLLPMAADFNNGPIAGLPTLSWGGNFMTTFFNNSSRNFNNAGSSFTRNLYSIVTPNSTDINFEATNLNTRKSDY